MASSLIPGSHAMSDLLTIREKGVLLTLLQPQSDEAGSYDQQQLPEKKWEMNGLFLIRTTVAQVLEARELQGGCPGWICLGCGVLCLTEVESIHSYFLCLYCVTSAKLLWEQELYIPFKYTATRAFFHTFPADGHHIGLNFADESEAEEFHAAVKAVQRNRENTTSDTEMTIAVKTGSSPMGQPDSGMTPVDLVDREQHFSMDAPSSSCSPNTSSLKDLDPAMRRLLMQARLTEEDLKDKDIAEAVDCIISKFGGLEAVQRELRSIGNATSQQTPHGRDSRPESDPPWRTPVPAVPERIKHLINLDQVCLANQMWEVQG
ncbi:neural Wiskott-Aldrich syndrome protein [Mastacembelus armatus]|uniref:neural Wiskott-Aldrich syndrome protein n=1 Tax=Mastacembelus armatus TaxID=205130 RepID=UPI000E4588AC|nr:neural Wiskott-Aldrich syndrome protein-like [Mastacembelus armatus]